MATDLSEEKQDDVEASEETVKETVAENKSKFSNKKLKTIALLFLVMLVEAAGIYVWLPQPSGGNKDENGVKQADGAEASFDSVEVMIDDFQPTNTTAEGDNGDVNLQFTLSAVVSRHSSTAFEDAVNNVNKFRVRQVVERICRSATLEELDDPEWSTLKRLMKEEINKILGKSYVIDIVISDVQVRKL